MIELKHVDAGYDGRSVLKDVSLTFQNGQISMILGRNGSGKSTLLKTCLGLIPLLSGEILYNGKSLEKLSPRELAKEAAALLQNTHTADLSVERMVLHGRFCHLEWPRNYGKEDKEIAWDALKTMKIEHLASRPLKDLSGGELQKVLLARSLAQQSDALFLDEPGTWLDLKTQRDLMRVLQDLKRQNLCLIMIVHDLISALENADQIFVLDQGRLAFSGTPREVLESGILDRVFEVRIRPVEYEGKTRYIYADD